MIARRIIRLLSSRGDSSQASPVGRWGRVTTSGAIPAGGVGEVAVEIRGGIEHFYATEADGLAVAPEEEVVVIDYLPPRTVTVARLGQEGE